MFSAPYLAFPATGLASTSQAAGDLNRDGKTDLIVIGGTGPPGYPNIVSVLLNQGNGLFGPRVNFGTGLMGQDGDVADFNHDGLPDLAVAGGSGLAVMFGDGSGTLRSPDQYYLHPRSQSIGVSDLNRDGSPDVAITYREAGFVDVFYGRPDGLFVIRELEVSPGSKHLALGDLNGDSFPDLVLALAEESSVSISLGKEDGTFGPSTPFIVSRPPGAVELKDLNGDNVLDLTILNSGSSSVSTLDGVGNGTFGAEHEWPVGFGPNGAAIADFNGDGRVDLAVSCTVAPGVVTVLSGGPNGDFSSRRDLLVGSGSVGVVAAHLDEGPTMDLSVASGANTEVLPGNGDGTFGDVNRCELGRGPEDVIVGDFNGDRAPDLAFTNRFSNTVSIFRGSGDAHFQKAIDLDAGRLPYLGVSGDWNRDGYADLAVTCMAGVAVFLARSDGGFDPRVDYSVGLSPQGIGVADLNNDTYSDLLLANRAENSLTVLLGAGDGTFGPPSHTFIGNIDQGALTTADFNLDGMVDVAIVRHNYPGYVTILLGKGDGGFSHQNDLTTSPGDNPAFIASGDLNRDGSPDLVVVNVLGYTMSVYLGNGDGSFGRAPTITDVNGAVELADWDSDGILDLIVGSDDSVQLRFGNGDGTFRHVSGYGTVGYVISSAIADMNQDCQPDIAAIRWGDVDYSNAYVLTARPGTAPLHPSRAFLEGGDRTLPVGSGPAAVCVRFEPVNASYENSDVDLSSLSMTSPGTGTIERIAPIVSMVADDNDRNGVAEIKACFSREDLAGLLGLVHGREIVPVTIEGRFRGCGSFTAQLNLTVRGKSARSVAVLYPNPLNPSGTLRFSVERSGPVSIRLFDVAGRLVRTVQSAQPYEPGDHSVIISGQDDRGKALPTGIYFYRLETLDGSRQGRFVIAK